MLNIVDIREQAEEVTFKEGEKIPNKDEVVRRWKKLSEIVEQLLVSYSLALSHSRDVKKELRVTHDHRVRLQDALDAERERLRGLEDKCVHLEIQLELVRGEKNSADRMTENVRARLEDCRRDQKLVFDSYVALLQALVKRS